MGQVLDIVSCVIIGVIYFPAAWWTVFQIGIRANAWILGPEAPLGVLAYAVMCGCLALIVLASIRVVRVIAGQSYLR
jgi:hypothetical protein